MRLFSRSRSNSKSPSKQKRTSMLLSFTTSTLPTEPEETPYHPYAPLDNEHESGALQQRNRNRSTSNLSTTSTLHEEAKSPPVQMTAYEQFVAQAREVEARRQHAWATAAEGRRAAAWPQDPWRGGFGPPAAGGYRMNSYVPGRAEPAGGVMALSPRWRERSGSGGGVRGWLGQNGLLRR